jgi:hypothetical protein
MEKVLANFNLIFLRTDSQYHRLALLHTLYPCPFVFSPQNGPVDGMKFFLRRSYSRTFSAEGVKRAISKRLQVETVRRPEYQFACQEANPTLCRWNGVFLVISRLSSLMDLGIRTARILLLYGKRPSRLWAKPGAAYQIEAW